MGLVFVASITPLVACDKTDYLFYNVHFKEYSKRFIDDDDDDDDDE